MTVALLVMRHTFHTHYLILWSKYSYPQFVDEETETEWLPEVFGTEQRKVSEGNAKEGAACPLSKPGILGSDFKFWVIN